MDHIYQLLGLSRHRGIGHALDVLADALKARNLR